jgi:Domain of unknown function (DUF4412)
MHRTLLPAAVAFAALLGSCSRTSSPPAAAAHPWAPSQTIARLPFEGTIRLDVLHSQDPTPVAVTYEIKGTRVRYEPVGGAAPRTVYLVADLARGQAHAVSIERGDYVDVSTVGAKAPAATFKPNGSDQTVAGYACEDWRMRTDGRTIDACVIKGVPFVDLVRRPPFDGPPAWAAELTREDAFPLRLVVRDSRGNEQLRFEAASVQEKPLDAGRFTLPARCRKIATAKDAVLFGID